MTDDRTRHSPGSTSIEPRDKRQKKPQEKGKRASDPPREAIHIESPGHVAQGTDRASPDRAYRKGTEEFVKSGHMEEQARKAAEALDSKEGRELRNAEDKGRSGKPRTKAR
jgi:hypothetical protein